MTCINLSYPDGSGPDDPVGNRTSLIHPEYARPPPYRLAIALGGSGQDCPGSG
jgi:hypothetical protein